MKKAKKRSAAPAFEPRVDLAPVRVPKSLRDAAIKKSEQTGIPLAVIMRRAVEAWVREDGREGGAGK